MCEGEHRNAVHVGEHLQEEVGCGARGCQCPAFEQGCAKCISFPFFFLFSGFNQEQMSEQANELETSETTVQAEV